MSSVQMRKSNIYHLDVAQLVSHPETWILLVKVSQRRFGKCGP